MAIAVGSGFGCRSSRWAVVGVGFGAAAGAGAVRAGVVVRAGAEVLQEWNQTTRQEPGS